jgi:Zn-dependent peptidase ImmA (M78 family)
LANKYFADWVERNGMGLRNQLNLKKYDPMNPEELAKKMGVDLFTPENVLGLSSDMLSNILDEDRKKWSAGTMISHSGKPFIIFNPTHCEERKRATLMEELAHLYLKHKPSEFIRFNGLAFRTHKQTVETQAYWVGSSALVPRHVLEVSVEKNISREYVAEKFLVSSALVKFRENVTGLKLAH